MDEGTQNQSLDIDAVLATIGNSTANGTNTDASTNPQVINPKKPRRGRPVGSKKGNAPVTQTHGQKRGPIPVDKLMSSDRCCDKDCIGSLDALSMQHARDTFQAKSQTEGTEWIRDHVSQFRPDENGFRECAYWIEKHSVCAKAWCMINGFDKRRLNRVLDRLADGMDVPYDRSLWQTGRRQQQVLVAIAWVTNYARLVGDKQPDQEIVHLPPCLTYLQLYELCSDEMTETGQHLCSLSHFYFLFDKGDLKSIRIPKVQRLGKCTICAAIKLALLNRGLSVVARKLVRSVMDGHLKLQKAERMCYYDKIRLAGQHPDKYISIIIDGMDQCKCWVPHVLTEAGVLSKIRRLKTHLTGVIVHGRDVFGFTDYNQWSHGPDLTITVLMRVICHYKESLPKTLFLQLDNCYRENKNQTVFSFLAMLVEAGVFEEIVVGFLMVGHTHEDIDQVFSRLATALKSSNALTIPSFLNVFERSQTRPRNETLTGIELDRVYNYSKWVKIVAYMDMKYHSHQHQFRFIVDENGRVYLQYKGWSEEDTWKDCVLGDLRPVENDKYLVAHVPEDMPEPLQPSFDLAELGQVTAGIETLKTKNLIRDSATVSYWEHWAEETAALTTGEPVHEVESREDRVDLSVAELAALVKENRRQTTEGGQSTGAAGSEADVLSPDERSLVTNLEKQANHTISKQIILGRESATKKKRHEPLKVGDMVCTDLPKYNHMKASGQIGKVVAIDGDQLEIEWWKGSMTTGNWKPWKYNAGSKRKPNMVAWCETIDAKDVWLHGFTFSGHSLKPPKLRLRQETQALLKARDNERQEERDIAVQYLAGGEANHVDSDVDDGFEGNHDESAIVAELRSYRV